MLYLVNIRGHVEYVEARNEDEVRRKLYGLHGELDEFAAVVTEINHAPDSAVIL